MPILFSGIRYVRNSHPTNLEARSYTMTTCKMLEKCLRMVYGRLGIKELCHVINKAKNLEVYLKSVFVVGAGPAGFYATQKLSRAGHSVYLFNRDIKPGGLAEYGIYPTKDKMKVGLRKQFGKILNMENVTYFGHSPVNSNGLLTIENLKEWDPAALVYAVGAQGTKKLGLSGEELKGVYSAKDFVYHYNLLPPFTSQDFSVGKRVAIIGMGNVMVDLAHWLLTDDPSHCVKEVIVIGRRGPFEVKFYQREFDYVEKYLDCKALEDELMRIKENLAIVGQDTSKVSQETFPVLAKSYQEPKDGRLVFRFLSSPIGIDSDASGRINSITIAQNKLTLRNGNILAEATQETAKLKVDTLIFAVGDIVDPSVGIPSKNNCYVTNPDILKPKQAAYEVFDPESSSVLRGSYVIGWARKASEGLVGKARYDAEQGIEHVLHYLDGITETSTPSGSQIKISLNKKGIQPVTKADLIHLAEAEETQSRKRGISSFKFGNDQDMLDAIESNRGRSSAA